MFAAVTAEAGGVLSADFTSLCRYDADGAVKVVGTWSGTGSPHPIPVGSWLPAEGANVHTQVFRTRRPARVDRFAADIGPRLTAVLTAGVRSGVGAPVWVEGRMWGVVTASSTGDPLPAESEDRLAGFTELVATAVANAEAHAALTASRARIVAAGDAIRQRIERDLHDGAQQRLVSLGLQLRSAQATVPPGAGELRRRLDDVTDGLTSLADELRQYARGIHPANLADGGLGPALKTLARRSPIPVHLDVRIPRRLPEPREICVVAS